MQKYNYFLIHRLTKEEIKLGSTPFLTDLQKEYLFSNGVTEDNWQEEWRFEAREDRGTEIKIEENK
jgi:hypothetical protein